MDPRQLHYTQIQFNVSHCRAKKFMIGTWRERSQKASGTLRNVSCRYQAILYGNHTKDVGTPTYQYVHLCIVSTGNTVSIDLPDSIIFLYKK